MYPNWDFWSEKKPSGNPAVGPVLGFKVGLRNVDRQKQIRLCQVRLGKGRVGILVMPTF
jgi:hypothetical protein